MNIGAVIKELRRNKGIKQEELADTLQVSVQTVSRWENEVNYPDLSMLPQLSAFFQVTTDYLLGVERSNTMAKLLKTWIFVIAIPVSSTPLLRPYLPDRRGLCC